MTSSGSTAPDGAGLPPVSRRSPLGHARNRFAMDPSSTRNAIYLIVAADVATVLVGGTIVWLADRQEYPQLTEAFWYVLQTITTVGYGDVTPTEPIGRFVGAFIMMLGIAFLSILTATITSSFIDAHQAARRAQQTIEDRAAQARLEAQFAALIDRFDRLEEFVRGNHREDA